MRPWIAAALRLCPILWALILLVACGPQPLTITREPATLRLVAADSCGSLAEEIAAQYEEAYPWVTVELDVFNAAVAEEMLRAGEVDLALLSWLEEGGDEAPLWSYPLVRDGIAVVVHPDLPLQETGLLHLQGIFRGHVQEWGGVVLTVVSREKGSGTRAAFEEAAMGTLRVTPSAVVMPSSEAVVEYVARTPGAIGYVSTLWLGGRDAVEGSYSVRPLPLEGARPTPEALADGSYPLPRQLYLATTGEPTGEAREFAQWVLGAEGQAIAGRMLNWQAGGAVD